MRRQVAIFNDTAAGGHYGCAAVMATIDALVARHGGRIIHRNLTQVDWREDAPALEAIDIADAIVVNGEGSIHSNKPKARRLAALGRYAAERGRRAFLINATLIGNDAELLADLAFYDRIWVRESRSLAELKRAGIEAEIVPDLSMLHDLVRHVPGTDVAPIAVVDSVLPARRRELLDMARAAGLDYWGIKRDPETGFCLGIGAGDAGPDQGGEDPGKWQRPLFPCQDFTAFAARIAASRHLVTGRFHAVCLAVATRTPFHAVTSNTSKIEATLADIGLDPRRVLPASAPVVMPAPLPYSVAELDAIEEYLTEARRKAGRMAERIFSSRPEEG